MGTIIKLDGKFSNKNLPKLQYNNVLDLETDINNNPNLVGWFDFTNVDNMTTAGNKVVKVHDPLRNITATANNTSAPTLDTANILHAPSLHFDGTQFMETNEKLLAKGKNYSIVMFALKPAKTTPSNTALWTAKAQATHVGSTDNNNIIGFSNNVAIYMPNLNTSPVEAIWCTNSTQGKYKLLSLSNGILKTKDTTALIADDRAILIGDYQHPSNWASKWQGYIGYIMVFNTDITNNPSLIETISEYNKRKFDTANW